MAEDFWDAIKALRLLIGMLAIGAGVLCWRDYRKGYKNAKWLSVMSWTMAAIVFICAILEWLHEP